jgi:hypothetical protein
LDSIILIKYTIITIKSRKFAKSYLWFTPYPKIAIQHRLKHLKILWQSDKNIFIFVLDKIRRGKKPKYVFIDCVKSSNKLKI